MSSLFVFILFGTNDLFFFQECLINQFSKIDNNPNWFVSSADGSYEVKMLTKAVVYHTGHILWQPPAIYKEGSGKIPPLASPIWFSKNQGIKEKATETHGLKGARSR